MSPLVRVITQSLGTFIITMLCTTLTACQGKQQPNIIFILADDYGWNDIGYHGSEIRTPNMDRLAGQEVKMENYYVQTMCTPSRSQFLSGRYQIHTGMQHGCVNAGQRLGLPLDHPTVADKLREAGYSTHMVGKWHVGFYRKEYTPTYRGFDSFYGYYNGEIDYFDHHWCQHGYCGLDLHDDLKPVWSENGTYTTNLFTQKSIDVINKHVKDKTKKPFFLYLAYEAVHRQLQVPESYKEQYSFIKNKDRRTYAGMTSAMDEGIGNISTALDKLGLWNNTVLIFSTDNGGAISGSVGNNWPLLGGKYSLWEGGLRGVSFVSSPLLKAIGTVNTGLMHISDWFPTLVGLAGVSPNGLQLDGYDMWRSITLGERSPRTELLHNIEPLYRRRGVPLYNDTFDTSVRAGIRSGRWKLLTGDVGPANRIPPLQLGLSSEQQSGHSGGSPHAWESSLSHAWDEPTSEQSYPWDDPTSKPSNPLDEETSDLPHLPIKPTKNLWLFDLENDPLEMRDISEERPDVVKRLLDRLVYYNSTSVPPLTSGVDPECDPSKHGGVWEPWVD